MADRYVWSGAAGSGTGADWANAHTTLSAAITASTAGDRFFVAHDHAQTQATSLTMTFKGTAASPDRVLCVNRAGSVPPVAADLTTGASVTTTATSNMTVDGHIYVQGLTFNCATGTGTHTLNLASSTSTSQKFKNCTFAIVATGNGTLSLGGGGGNAAGNIVIEDCTLSFSGTGQGLTVLGTLLWMGGSVSGTLPTSLFKASSNAVTSAVVKGVDLSALGSGKNIVGTSTFRPGVRLENCKLGASVTIASTPSDSQSLGTRSIGCHSSGNVRRDEIYLYQGTLTTETTIVRTGGASDGTTAYSWKIVPTTNNEREFPCETFEGALWNDTTGSAKTLTVHTVTDNVTLTDAEIWLEVEYLGSSATPVTTLITDANATVLTTAAAQATSTETWTTTGLTTPVKQKLEVTFTPQMVGPIRWRVKYAKTSTTVYVCPKAELS